MLRTLLVALALCPVSAIAGAQDAFLGADPTSGTWEQTAPPDWRLAHGAVYDPVRNRMIVVTGYDALFDRNDAWALSLSDPPEWTELVRGGPAPPARLSACTIYDPAGDRVLVFGGGYYDGTHHYLNDVWALSLSGTPAWTQLAPLGTPPPPEEAACAIYDPLRGRMIVFGGGPWNPGYTIPRPTNRVWALSLSDMPTWTELTPSGAPPAARSYATAIYDPDGDRMVVFGGRDSASVFNDVWALSLSGTPAWTQVVPTGAPPAVRCAHTAIHDPVRDRMVVFDGRGTVSSQLFDDVWELTLTGAPGWTQLHPSGSAPLARAFHSAVYDVAQDRMLVFGGREAWGMIPYQCVYALSLAGGTAWTTPILADPMPQGRWGHTAIHDVANDRMVVFGGMITKIWATRQVYMNDVWVSPLGTPGDWTQLSTTGSPGPPRAYHTAVYDPVRRRMLAIQGVDSTTFFSDVRALSLTGPPVWSLITPTGGPPAARCWASAVYDPVRDRVLVFGGYSGTYRNDLWALNLSGTPSWTWLNLSNPPHARVNHTAMYDPVRDRMLVFGGYYYSGGGYYLNDVWQLSLSGTPTWTMLTPLGTPPPARYAHTAAYDPYRDRMIVYGGSSAAAGWSLLWDDLWALSLGTGPTWTELAPDDPPLPHGLHAALYDPVRDRMTVFGGQGGWNA